MRALLDVNVLIALHDRNHIHHATAARWLQEHAEQGWASCPLTQNGCLRIMGQPGYANPQPLSVLTTMLGQSTATRFHQFWPDDISLLDARHINPAHLHGARQLTDLYLLALAVHHGGRFVTFDRRIALSAVPGAQEDQLVVI